MERLTLEARELWQEKVEEVGFVYHSAGGHYWHEEAAYEFTLEQAEELEAATTELHQLCLDAVQHVIDQKRYAELAIPEHAVQAIETSWEEEPPSIYGRFDLGYDGVSPPKLFEYNADTPTSLLEASVVQWRWMEDIDPTYDQFNSIHDKLIALWTELRPHLWSHLVHFVSMDDREDGMTITYLRETAEIAGLETKGLCINDLGYDAEHKVWDLEEEQVLSCFKLYPWEWLIHELDPKTLKNIQFMEPAWKMILSNKGILPILWELNPGHPNLLEAHFEPTEDMRNWGFVKKPLLSREGANITVNGGVLSRDSLATQGEYGAEGYIYQAKYEIPNFGGNYPVIGSWIIGQEAAGIGIREADGPITTNLSRFVPHRIIQ